MPQAVTATADQPGEQSAAPPTTTPPIATPPIVAATETTVASPTVVDEAAIRAKFDEGFEAASWTNAREEMDFNSKDDGWAKRALREAAWMRVELPAAMAGVGPTRLPDGCSPTGQLDFTKTRVRRRGGEVSAGGGTRERPKIYDYVVDGSRAYIINFATADASLLLQAGLGSCPCSNPQCAGEGGVWKTTPTHVLLHSAVSTKIVPAFRPMRTRTCASRTRISAEPSNRPTHTAPRPPSRIPSAADSRGACVGVRRPPRRGARYTL